VAAIIFSFSDFHFPDLFYKSITVHLRIIMSLMIMSGMISAFSSIEAPLHRSGQQA
jgi:hypothetical protein